MKVRLLIALPAVVAATVLPASSAGAAPAATPDAAAVIPPRYKNCTNLNKKYRTGWGSCAQRQDLVRRAGDELRPQHQALHQGDELQQGASTGDKDGIACEKA